MRESAGARDDLFADSLHGVWMSLRGEPA